MSRNRSDWSPEHDAVLYKDYPDKPTSEVAESLGRTMGSVFGRAKLLGIKKSDAFKKSSHSGRVVDYPVGSIKEDSNGYLFVKVYLDGPVQERWKRVHIIEWEEHHGPVPEGYIVSFKDGDKKNTVITNLYLTTYQDMMRKNTIHNYPEEVAQAIRTHAWLNRVIKRRSEDA